MPCYGLKFDSTYKGLAYCTDTVYPYVSIKLHSERRSFYEIPGNVLF